jgi:hypothetical protein
VTPALTAETTSIKPVECDDFDAAIALFDAQLREYDITTSTDDLYDVVRAVSANSSLGFANSQTKCNTNDVWRERKKKSLEGAEEWREDRNEVSATQWGRAERAGGVASGGVETGGDRTGTGTTPEHSVTGTAAQSVATRWPVSSESGAGANASAKATLAAEHPV